jgi:Fe-S-cluster containining protein
MRRFAALANAMKKSKPFPVPVRVSFSCKKCPAYCCTYEEIPLRARDIARLARHFGLDAAQVEARYTRPDGKQARRVLRHRKDGVFKSACMFLDQGTRQCTVYEARPAICRDFPGGRRCGYYDFLKFERHHQDDPDFIALT